MQLAEGDYYVDIGSDLEDQRFELPLSMEAVEAARVEFEGEFSGR